MARRAILSPVFPTLSERSEPEPDLMVLRPRNDDYAVARVAEVWLVDLQHDRIELFTNPGPNGYADHHIVQPEETFAPMALPECRLRAEQVL